MGQLPYTGVRIAESSATLSGRLAGLLFADQGALVQFSTSRPRAGQQGFRIAGETNPVRGDPAHAIHESAAEAGQNQLSLAVEWLGGSEAHQVEAVAVRGLTDSLRQSDVWCHHHTENILSKTSEERPGD